MLESLEQELDSCQIVDAFRLRRKLQEVVKASTAGFLDSNAVASLAESIKISQKCCVLFFASLVISLSILSGKAVVRFFLITFLR